MNYPLEDMLNDANKEGARLRAENVRLEQLEVDLKVILRHALESTDDSCQCGFWEEKAEEEGGWSVCWMCAAKERLEPPTPSAPERKEQG